MSEESTKMTVKGSCHCGFVKYECTVKKEPQSEKFKAFRCNCTYCQKMSTTNFRLDGPEDFKLLSPASQTEVANYESKSKSMNRYFCATCGVHVWMQGTYEIEGKAFNPFIINLCTVDQPQEGLELSEVKVVYWDGLNNNFSAGVKDEPWLGVDMECWPK